MPKLLFSALLLLFCTGSYSQVVTLDCYYNHEVRPVKIGGMQRYHYLWTETDNAGFSVLGSSFKSQGAKLDTLLAAPTLKNLSNSAIYIIVDPDTKKESPEPNYMSATDAGQIAGWVKNGGVLLLMANDSANVELPHFNILASKFGMHFNNDLVSHVVDDAHFNDGVATVTDKTIFKTALKPFLKDVCSISIPANAKPALKDAGGKIIAASVKYGKGTVFAVGDPWLYNEYVNGRLPAGFDNDAAAVDLTSWLLKQIPSKK